MFWVPIISWVTKGGWKLLAVIGLAAGIFFSAMYVVNKLEELGRVQAEFVALQEQQNSDIARIATQNEENQNLLDEVRNNTATIGTLRRQLTDLRSTISSDMDPTQFEAGLEAIMSNQFTCIERISRDETNATCI